MKCDHCCNPFKAKDIVRLKYLGWFCKKHAIVILKYWADNAKDVLDKLIKGR